MFGPTAQKSVIWIWFLPRYLAALPPLLLTSFKVNLRFPGFMAAISPELVSNQFHWPWYLNFQDFDIFRLS